MFWQLLPFTVWVKNNLHDTNKAMFYFEIIANGDLSASTNDKALHK